MKKHLAIEHEFVDFIPAHRAERKIYVSIEYATAVHNCFCGCGSKVVTPISPTGWQLTFDGDTISLYPSVGSWGLPCRSHYWIDQDKAVWAGDMSQSDIDRGRRRDRFAREAYFHTSEAAKIVVEQLKDVRREGLWARLRALFR
jgi:hypothetical protein